MIDYLSIVLRALSFIAIFQGCGMAMFLWLFRQRLPSGLQRSVRRTAIATTLAAMLLVAGHFVLEPARMGGEFAAIADPTLRDMALSSPLAAAFVWRLAGLALLLIGLIMSSPAGRAIALLGAAVALLAFTQVGHTASLPPRLTLAVLLMVHLVIVAFWFGALLPLRRLSLADTASAAVIVEAFSRIALWLVPVLFLAGLGLAALLLQGWHALSAPYGRIILLKVALFAALMLLAALNKWRYGPALARQASAGRALARTIAVEYVLIAAVLTATAALTTLFSPDY